MGKLYGVLIALSFIWGTSFLFIKVLLDDMSPSAIVFGRCFFGTITLVLIALIRKDRLWTKNTPWIPLLVIALLNNVLPWLFISTSETSISSGLASILNATTPIWTLMIGFLFFSTSLSRFQWIGIIIGFLGILLLSDFELDVFNNDHTMGVIFMTAAAACYGVASQMTRRFLRELTVMQISFYTLFFSTVISFCILLIYSPNSLPVFFHIINLLPFLGLGVLGSGVAYLLYYYLVTKGSPEFASFVTYLVPISAIVWGALLLEEVIHTSMIVGLFIIFIGVYISSYKSKDDNKKEKSVA